MNPALRNLILRWHARDHRYAVRKVDGIYTPLSEREQRSVLRWRRHEAADLTGTDWTDAIAELSRWQPPQYVNIEMTASPKEAVA